MLARGPSSRRWINGAMPRVLAPGRTALVANLASIYDNLPSHPLTASRCTAHRSQGKSAGDFALRDVGAAERPAGSALPSHESALSKCAHASNGPSTWQRKNPEKLRRQPMPIV